MSLSEVLKRTCLPAAVCVALVWLAPLHAQEDKEIVISYKGKKFEPAVVSAPANAPLTLHVKNLDAVSMEFESTTLRVEKVVPAHGETTISVRPLKPGRYEFFDDLNDASTGTLNVR